MSYLHKSNTSTSTSYTLSMWIKTAKTSGTTSSAIFWNGATNKLVWELNDKGQIYYYNGSVYRTTAYLRDIHGFYHLVWKVSSGTGTLYINGNSALIAGNVSGVGALANGTDIRLGNDGGGDFTGSMAHVHFTDGTAYNPTTFAESDSNGVWVPKLTPSVSYGSGGFFLKFDNDSNMGLDSSGQGNNLTVNGTMIQAKDTPSNVHTVGNTLIKGTVGASTATNLNLTATSGQASWETLFGTIAVNSGKWYAEFKTGATGTQAGVIDVQQGQVHDIYGGSQSRGWGYDSDGIIYNNASNTGGTYASLTAGDVIGVALDMDNHKVYFHKNGTYQNSGDPTSGASGTGAKSITAGYDYTFFFGAYNGNMSANFGNGHFGTTKITSAGSNGNGSLFEYDVPTGYYALNTKNLKDQS